MSNPVSTASPATGRSALHAAPLIELQHVSKAYTTGGGEPVTILDDISLAVREGEMLALLGQSGSGKSTILRLIAGLTDPTNGAVLSHGKALEGINRKLSIVFQSFALYPWLTVQQNVQVGLTQRRLSVQQEQEEIDKVLTLIGLSGFENAFPKELSGGMRQRVGLARAIVAKPEVLCMDEAFSALDVLTAENLRAEVVDLWNNASETGIKSIFFVTHNIVEAAYMASRIVIISSHPGRIKNVIQNPLPYPRDVKSKEFAALVNQIHDAITALALPDEPGAEVALAETGVDGEKTPEQEVQTAAQDASSNRVEPIPNVPVGRIVGLLEILQNNQETINIYELSTRIGTDFGETIAIVKAAEMLDLVDTPKHEVNMTTLGWYFLAAPMAARKTLFRKQILRLRLFQMLTTRLNENPGAKVKEDDILEELASLLPYDQPESLFATLISWGRYAEIIDYDQRTGTVHLEAHEPQVSST
ncbi:ABC-type nitrate/sulfonate/bicarbonate transport system [Collimonas arenae]|uniref:ABC-type nitrate/sulfonate/bicarbonate transport system n=1 Tax=Collimonas arenae TaxID=279058 RepID=A0A0A1FL53_9BURK|nr:nitrate/sulfonate/bicarbonate ABC transporter ATP-binding protein [Collimonas arenae]AIY43642.1 ABC-type nitrate/sulfonate/bicarbonate transport system [Collimonas arenae]